MTIEGSKHGGDEMAERNADDCKKMEQKLEFPHNQIGTMTNKCSQPGCLLGMFYYRRTVVFDP